MSSPLNRNDFAKIKNISDRTLRRKYACCWEKEIKFKRINISDQVLIIDGFFLRRNEVALIARTREKVAGWIFAKSETTDSWKQLFLSLNGAPKVIVCDGQKGMLKAIKEVFLGVIIQRCHFHLLSRNRALLTKNPETKAAQELTFLVNSVPRIKSKVQLNLWLQDYRLWLSKYDQFLKEKTYPPFDDIYLYKNYTNGKRPWFYTHQRLRRAHYQLRKAIPFLFQYLKFPHLNIPNTTNLLEGGINSPLSELLRRHRGLTLEKQKVLVANFLAQKQ